MRFSRSLETSANRYHLTVYCGGEAHFRKTSSSQCEVVELPEINRWGARRAKFAAVAAALRGGSVLYLDPNAIVLEDLEEFWGGDRILGLPVALGCQAAGVDRFHPWPWRPDLVNRRYLRAGAFFAPAARCSFFDRLWTASLDDEMWRSCAAPGIPADQHFLSALVNLWDEPVRFLDPHILGPEGFLQSGEVQVRRLGSHLVNRRSGKTLLLAQLGDTELSPELFHSLPGEVTALLSERSGCAEFVHQSPPTPSEHAAIAVQPRASITPLDPDRLALRPGEIVFVHIRLGNASPSALSSRHQPPVNASYHWLTGDGQIAVWDGLRTALPFDLTPGATAGFPIGVMAPEQEGEYELRIALVQEQVAWFDGATQPASVPAVVRAGTDDSTPAACAYRGVFLRRNPELELSPSANACAVPLQPVPVQLTPLVLLALSRFGSSAALVDEVFPHASRELYATIEELVEQTVLLRTEGKCLITGCGRSGTKYAAALLSAAGLRIGHETMGRDGIASWLLAALPAAPGWGPSGEDFHFRTILHQVRNPLAAISSMQTIQPTSWRYICQHVPCSMEDPLLFRCATYWREWNLKAESIAAWSYRLEDIDSAWEELCARLALPATREALNAVARNLNTRKGSFENVTWDDLKNLDPRLCLAVQEQAARYGYQI
jgi:hypothetical protein